MGGNFQYTLNSIYLTIFLLNSLYNIKQRKQCQMFSAKPLHTAEQSQDVEVKCVSTHQTSVCSKMTFYLPCQEHVECNTVYRVRWCTFSGCIRYFNKEGENTLSSSSATQGTWQNMTNTITWEQSILNYRIWSLL